MFAALFGTIFGLMLGGVVFGLLYYRFDRYIPSTPYEIERSRFTKNEVKRLVFANKLFNTALCLLIINICSFTVVQISKEETRQYVQEYLAVKSTIESSIQSESITGFERIELVKKASEYNGDLAEIQYKCKQWYGFNIDQSVLELEPIALQFEEVEE